MLKQDNLFICDVCKKGFKTLKGLKSHKTQIHKIKILNKFICKECGKEFESDSNDRIYCSKHCSNKNSSRISHLKNPKMSEETKRKISKKHKGKILSEEHKQNIKISINKLNKSLSIIERKEKYGHNNNIGSKRSEKQKNNISFATKNGMKKVDMKAIHNRQEVKLNHSIAATNSIINGLFDVKSDIYKTGYFFSSINNKEFYYRSSYELRAYKQLEEKKDIIKYWKTECLRIPYIDENGQQRNTVPDILVEYKDGKKQIIECKPQWKLDKDIRTKLKIEATQKYCDKNGIVFSIWTEKELVK